MPFLQELRDFKKNHPDRFDQIKNIPQRARTSRKASEVDSPINVDNASITYIKSEGHPGVFYKTDANNLLQELTFVDAAKIFKADIKEKAVKLPENHHKQVSQALKYFKSAAKNRATKNITKAELSNREREVIRQLEPCIRAAKNKSDKDQLQRTLDEIYKGSHKQLPNKISKFFKLNTENNPQKMTENLVNNVLKNMNFSEPARTKEQNTSLFSEPQIVISESYIKTQ